MYPLGVRKQLRAQDMAMEHKLPVVYLVDSGGAFLPLQSELFADAQHGGRVFYNQAHMSAMGIPQVSQTGFGCVGGGEFLVGCACAYLWEFVWMCVYVCGCVYLCFWFGAC